MANFPPILTLMLVLDSGGHSHLEAAHRPMRKAAVFCGGQCFAERNPSAPRDHFGLPGVGGHLLIEAQVQEPLLGDHVARCAVRIVEGRGGGGRPCRGHIAQLDVVVCP